MQTKVWADGVKVVAMVELGILHSRVTPSPISTSDLRPWTLDLEFDLDCDNREMLSKVSSVMWGYLIAENRESSQGYGWRIIKLLLREQRDLAQVATLDTRSYFEPEQEAGESE